ncbi:RNA polymerase sigma factor [Proteiniborus sp. MB09-C3]|uniref:RNA polymerase sigma factor n=1 Tax=Proteiniborus sp. MB09-C3 TaxID=3050072 RepID=UPI00255638FA|nr:RNA polymerase sigma factor [Proteiniborus sp. MB09-C3]WIV12865.1 RNA polymerase sigma factor [Proteiniborus sp. MB09-C3]
MGNTVAFEELMNPYIKILYNYILSNISSTEDIKDILQETMLAAWQGLKGFKRNSSFKTWVIGITRRKIADFYRKHYNSNYFETLEFKDIENISSSFDQIDNMIDCIDIEKSFATLSLQDRELLFLIFNAQLSYTEIANITGIPKGTIKSRIHYLKYKLRPLLEERSV